MFGRLAAAASAVMAGFIVAAVISGGDDKLIIGAIIAAVAMLGFAGAEWYTSSRKAATMEAGGINTGGGDINAHNVAGRDVNITHAAPPPKPPVVDAWEDEPNAPTFKLNVAGKRLENGYEGELGFYQRDGGPVGGVRGRFRGGGVKMEMVKPRDEAAPRHYRMPDITFVGAGEPDPELGEGMVGLEIQFNWEGVERHAMWSAPFTRDEGRSRWDINWRADPDRFWSVIH